MVILGTEKKLGRSTQASLSCWEVLVYRIGGLHWKFVSMSHVKKMETSVPFQFQQLQKIRIPFAISFHMDTMIINSIFSIVYTTFLI